VIDPQYHKISNCCWNLNEFFNEYLIDEEIRAVLRKEMFQDALIRFGLLKKYEIYIFSLAFALGGYESVGELSHWKCTGTIGYSSTIGSLA
jgi:hypothetical protein